MDLTSLQYGRGVSRYTANLFVALSQLPTVEMFGLAYASRQQTALDEALNQLRGLLSSEQQADFAQRVRRLRVPTRLNYALWQYGHINSVRKNLPQVEVFHSWDYAQPPDKNLPLVSTIHDLAILKYPTVAHREVLRHHRQAWATLKKRGAQLIAVSQTTRRDAINYLNFPPERVHLVYEALPTESILLPSELTLEASQQVRARYLLPKDFLLFVGTREPRKNLHRLIEAWWPLRAEIQLAIVGATGWNEPKLQHPHLRILGRVPDHDLGLLYYSARATVYPSLDEGFGLPILESFAYGTPVVTSRGTATEEVGGSAAILVDPREPASIRAGLEKVLDETNQQQQARRQLMQRQLAKFSWERVARETARVYQLAYEEHDA